MMRRTLLIPVLTMLSLLLVAGSAFADEPPGAPGGVVDGSPAGDLDSVKNEGERRGTSKRSRDREERDEAREKRSRDRRRTSRSGSSSRRDREESVQSRRSRRARQARRDVRRAYREHSRRRARRSVRVHDPVPRVVVRHSQPRPRVVVVERAPAPVVVQRPAPRREKTGATAGWRHVGGGFGAAYVPEFGAATPMGRFELGAGGYTVGLYGGGGLEIAGSSATPVGATGVGYVGMAIPAPVVHPLIGVKVGGGVHLDYEGVGPHVAVGPQAGVILRPYDGSFGLRVMFDLEAVIKPTKGEVAPQAMLTFAGVF